MENRKQKLGAAIVKLEARRKQSACPVRDDPGAIITSDPVPLRRIEPREPVSPGSVLAAVLAIMVMLFLLAWGVGCTPGTGISRSTLGEYADCCTIDEAGRCIESVSRDLYPARNCQRLQPLSYCTHRGATWVCTWREI